MLKDLENRADVYKLVNTFYAEVRKNDLVGPNFNKHINNWPEHLKG
ncbi:hypothetical protein [Croceivirga lutea]|nr:hypothetical protein [Croceivirga lutea]